MAAGTAAAGHWRQKWVVGGIAAVEVEGRDRHTETFQEELDIGVSRGDALREENDARW